MLIALLAQLRFAASVTFGAPFDIGSLERLVDTLVRTRWELGAVSAEGAELLGAPVLDEASTQELQLRRFRKQAARARHETDYYQSALAGLGPKLQRLTASEIARMPVTGKAALQADPDAFVRRGTRPAYRFTTTGTTGRPASVAFSADELRSYTLLAAMALLVHGTVSEEDVVQISTSARAMLGNRCFGDACARIGALVHTAGLVDPAHTLALLAEERGIGGKKARVSALMTYPSHLGELVEHGPALGYTPARLGVERLIVGGELVTAGLLRRARRLFGEARVIEAYGMTETWPLGGLRCADGHLHFEPVQGLVEVIDPETAAPAQPGQPGTLVVTPFAPYRQTTLLLRYDTEDVVRRLAEVPTCGLRHLPATGPLLGKLRLAARHEHGWTFPRDVLEALEALDDVPLPARCGFWTVPGGVAVEVVARSDDAAVQQRIVRSLDGRGVPVRELRVVHDPRELRRPLPLRCDLREAAFGPSAPEPRAALRSHADGLLVAAGVSQGTSAVLGSGGAAWI